MSNVLLSHASAENVKTFTWTSVRVDEYIFSNACNSSLQAGKNILLGKEIKLKKTLLFLFWWALAFLGIYVADCGDDSVFSPYF